MFKIVKLFESNMRMARTESYGDVDVRLHDAETREETECAKRSLESFEWEHSGKPLIRLVTIIEEDDLKKADRLAGKVFEETTDLFSRTPLARIRPCDGAGYWVDMRTGQTKPYLRPEESIEFPRSNLFQVHRGPFGTLNIQQFVAAGHSDELSRAYLRSIHWHNQGGDQQRDYLRFLYSWIALETIAKTEHHETIVPKIAIGMGFPLGRRARTFPQAVLGKLFAIHNYRSWRDFIIKHLEESRKIRNDIVHSGFKETDLELRELDIKLYILDYAFNSVITYMEQIIANGVRSLREAWKMMPHQVANNQHLAEQVSGNLFYSLSDPDNMIHRFRG